MRSTRRRAAMALALPTAAVLALSACAPGGGTTASSGGDNTLTLGMTADIPGLSVLIQPSYQGWFADAAWDALLICDEFGKPSAQLAEEWEYNDDQSSATLKLREGVKFSDGSDFDAADVEASLTAIGEVNARFEGLTYESPDANTITINFPQPIPTLDLIMCEANITSSEAVEGGNLDNEVVGSGPYLYQPGDSTVGSTYTLTKNPDYWDSETYPYDKLVLKVFTNETAALNALKTDQINGTLVSAATVDEAKTSGQDIVTLRGVTTRLLLTDHNGEKIPALGDVRVRQAMNMVFDRDAVAEQLYRGYADPAYQIFRPGSDAYLEDLTTDPYPYDIEKAKALMAEAGYADGFTLQIPFLEGQNHDLLFPYITAQLAELNITVEQANLSGPDAITNLLSGDYPVPLWQLGNYGESLQDIKDYVLPDGIWNVSHQTDATIDGLWQQILSGTPEERVTAEQEINQYIIDQAWFVPMAYPDGFYAHSPSVEIPTTSDFSALHPLLRDFQ
ncbi:ABC transporter substrate-binding protein [Rathayibacter festucae]|uniref:ABC transporter substrate-binding protein n=1 Tax=Rathayibacter festucae TaxID=110937 RepID=UPI001FB1D1C4|nr:ABC transporter substrate-binding protein [Rathayibacter festucae]MCJ1701812.1 ABC transporter substrate-binding protein [Rathayibacter festucae]